jgi:outer membrane biosynthesis protein TonB
VVLAGRLRLLDMPIHSSTLPSLPLLAKQSWLVAALSTGCLVSQPASAGPGDTPQAQVEGSLDKPAVREVVKTNIDQVRDCYNAELVRDETIAGRSVIAFVVGPDGSTGELAITESTMPDSFDACLIAAIQTWSFPTSDGQTRVSYPFNMSAG